jgi:zona occludens toxin
MSEQIGAGLTLVTGNTGSGKTALVVKMIKETKDRPIFVMGIPDLKIDHFKCPPVEQWTEQRPDPDDPKLLLPYFTFPENAIVVIDEAQRIYRPRPAGSKVPDFVAAFETRRHTGVDFVLLTQHPTFVDSHCRKLVKRHIHIYETVMGRYRLEWTGLGDPENAASRDLAARERYKPPKEVFGLYKSAELHTKEVKKRPWLIYAFVPLVFGVLGGIWYVYQRIDARTHEKPVAARQQVPSGGANQPVQGQDRNAPKKPLTGQEYVAQYKPRIDGLMHTAPAYDDVTKPVEVPEPVGCMDSKKTGCRCYTQQGTLYETTESICRQIMSKGLFMAWKRTEKPVVKDSSVKVATKESESSNDRVSWIQTPDKPMELSPYKSSGSSTSESGNDSTNPKYNPAVRGS